MHLFARRHMLQVKGAVWGILAIKLPGGAQSFHVWGWFKECGAICHSYERQEVWRDVMSAMSFEERERRLWYIMNIIRSTVKQLNEQDDKLDLFQQQKNTVNSKTRTISITSKTDILLFNPNEPLRRKRGSERRNSAPEQFKCPTKYEKMCKKGISHHHCFSVFFKKLT